MASMHPECFKKPPTPLLPPSQQSTATPTMAEDKAYGRAVLNPEIECLYKNLPSALTILRIAREQLEINNSSDERAVSEFYERIGHVERYFMDISSNLSLLKTKNRPFIIAVEGLDGCGKTSLVLNLAQALNNENENNHIKGIAVSTPPKSMSEVRDIFDKRGGPIARAFYMVSNYVLLYDITEEININNAKTTSYVVVVDRWYTSTCAYTIGYKNTVNGPETVDSLDSSLFAWPHDLPKPDLVVLLQVDDKVRKDRVHTRAAEEKIINNNPWDARLSNDSNLGKRIFRSLQRCVAVSGMLSVIVDANLPQVEVLKSALADIEQRVQCHVDPSAHFKHRPLEFFVSTCANLGLCDAKTGRRGYHKPWAMQLALNNSDSTRAPSLRTVGIHTVNEGGFLFFSRGNHPGGGIGGERLPASIVWVGGDYPYEQQWRAEGFLWQVASSECQFLDSLPPASLVDEILACQAQEGAMDNGVSRKERGNCTSHHLERAQKLRPQNMDHSNVALKDVKGTRFIPLRMEVLIGGPSSPGGPRRYEWTRTTESSLNENSWSAARSILTFTPAGTIVSPTPPSQLRPITVAITGGHCSGKSTIGQKLASVMNWEFHKELGDILRETIPVSGHREGYNSAKDWDDTIYNAETRRDQETKCSRIVETW